MVCDDSFLDISIINPELHRRYFQYPSNKGQILEFNDIAEWRDHLYTFRIRSHRVPVVYAAQFHIALKLLLFAWADGNVLKVAELAALSALESSLASIHYPALLVANPPKKKRHKAQEQKHNQEPRYFGLAKYLDYMVEHDHLSEIYLYENSKGKENALNKIRNSIAHGDLFTGFPWGGLMETVRDIIEHAFRHYPECSGPLEQRGDLLLEKGSAEPDIW